MASLPSCRATMLSATALYAPRLSNPTQGLNLTLHFNPFKHPFVPSFSITLSKTSCLWKEARGGSVRINFLKGRKGRMWRKKAGLGSAAGEQVSQDTWGSCCTLFCKYRVGELECRRSFGLRLHGGGGDSDTARRKQPMDQKFPAVTTGWGGVLYSKQRERQADKFAPIQCLSLGVSESHTREKRVSL